MASQPNIKTHCQSHHVVRVYYTYKFILIPSRGSGGRDVLGDIGEGEICSFDGGGCDFMGNGDGGCGAI